MVFAARDPGEELAGLPELDVAGLREADARALLDSVLTGPLDERVRDQIVAETRGNPLALIELPRGLSPGQLAGGFGLPGAVPLSGRIEESFGRQLDALPAADPDAAGAGGGGPVRRPRAGVAGGRAAGDRFAGGDGGGGGRPGRLRRPGALPASAAALGGLPVRVGGGPAGHPRGPGRGDRSGRRPGPPRLAPRPGGGRTRTTRSRTSSSTRRAGRRPAAAWPRRRRSSNARRC